MKKQRNKKDSFAQTYFLNFSVIILLTLFLVFLYTYIIQHTYNNHMLHELINKNVEKANTLYSYVLEQVNDDDFLSINTEEDMKTKHYKKLHKKLESFQDLNNAKAIFTVKYNADGNAIIVVDGMDTADENHTWDVRSTAGMVFQNPDNQIIGQVVEEDVGFGPENLGVPTKEIWERVEESLKAVGMYEYRKYSPNKLSGGQKQRVSIAGVLAMHPKCIVLDEPTAMLDPNGRKDVIRAARALNDVENVTIILITHYMEEVIYADRVFVMDEGRVVMQGTPREIFSQVVPSMAL